MRESWSCDNNDNEGKPDHTVNSLQFTGYFIHYNTTVFCSCSLMFKPTKAYAMLKRLFGDFPLIEAYEKVTQIIFHFDMM